MVVNVWSKIRLVIIIIMKRREFLVSSAISGAALGFSGFLHRAEAFEKYGSIERFKIRGYGELFPTAAENTGEKILALPQGFKYMIIGKLGDKTSDGRQTPADHDGMAAFAAKGEIRVVRNHEVNDDVPKENVAIGASNHYDGRQAVEQ